MASAMHMRGHRWIVVLLGLALALGACDDSEVVPAPTQVTLEIACSDATLLDTLTDLRVSVALHADDGWGVRRGVTVPASSLRWPVEIPVTPRSSADTSAEFEVVIQALAGDAVLAETRAITAFVRDEQRRLKLSLFRCPGHEHEPGYSCAEDGCQGDMCQVCAADGRCVPVQTIDPEELPVASEADASTQDAGVIDAGRVVEAGLDAASDGSSSPSEAGLDTGVSLDTGVEIDAGVDASSSEAGDDAGTDAELDAAGDAERDAAGDGALPVDACALLAEVCDGVDNNCNGAVDEGVKNACGQCGAVPAEICDGLDNNCSGTVDEGVKNACGQCGAVPAEICDGVDNNCNGTVDEGVKNACGQCGAVPAEICDGKDNDCDGTIDDGVKNACGQCGAVPAEVCDGVDNNCNGSTDEGVKNACGQCGTVPAEDCNTAGDDNCDGRVNEGCRPQCVPTTQLCHGVGNDADCQLVTGTTYTYDQNGLLISKTYPSGAFWAYSYNSSGNLVRKVDPSGLAWNFLWTSGTLTRVQTPMGQSVNCP